MARLTHALFHGLPVKGLMQAVTRGLEMLSLEWSKTGITEAGLTQAALRAGLNQNRSKFRVCGMPFFISMVISVFSLMATSTSSLADADNWGDDVRQALGGIEPGRYSGVSKQDYLQDGYSEVHEVQFEIARTSTRPMVLNLIGKQASSFSGVYTQLIPGELSVRNSTVYVENQQVARWSVENMGRRLTLEWMTVPPAFPFLPDSPNPSAKFELLRTSPQTIEIRFSIDRPANSSLTRSAHTVLAETLTLKRN